MKAYITVELEIDTESVESATETINEMDYNFLSTNNVGILSAEITNIEFDVTTDTISSVGNS